MQSSPCPLYRDVRPWHGSQTSAGAVRRGPPFESGADPGPDVCRTLNTGPYRQCVAALGSALARQPGYRAKPWSLCGSVACCVVSKRNGVSAWNGAMPVVSIPSRPWRHLTGKSWLLGSRRGSPTPRELLSRTVYPESTRSDRFGGFWSTIMSMGSANGSSAAPFVPSM